MAEKRKLVRTGVKATTEELGEALRLHEEALRSPIFLAGSTGRQLMSSAEQLMHDFIHQAALNHGLPEIEGYYGIDRVSQEFVRYEE